MSGYTELKEIENRSPEQTQMPWQQAWRGSWACWSVNSH